MAPNWSQHTDLFDEEFLIIAALCYNVIKKKNRKRKHRWWVHSLQQKRKEKGAYHQLVRELQLDGEKFQQYFRVTREQFGQILEYVEADLVKHCRTREVLCPKQRLAICLR